MPENFDFESENSFFQRISLTNKKEAKSIGKYLKKHKK